MSTSNPSSHQIRRWYLYQDETYATEIGVPADGPPLRKIVVGACLKNPFSNGRYTHDLMEVVRQSAELAPEFGRRLKSALGSEVHQSIGKACVVGMAGEYEHGNAFLTSTFADPLRQVLGGGKAWIASTGKRGGPGTSIDIPLAHKDALYVRDNYDTVTVTLPDGPNPDEVLILIAVATRGRLHARLGGPTADSVKGEDGLH